MRILIVQLKRLGDVVLTTPMISALREFAPDAEITLALDASARSLADLLDADHKIFFDRSGFRFWKSIAAGGFDITFDVTGNDRSALVAALSRAPRRVTWQRMAKKPLRRLIYNTLIDSSVKLRHTADHHTDLLRAMNIETDGVPSALTIPESARDSAGKHLSGIDRPFAVVHPGTARPEKYWNADRWACVIDSLRREHGLDIVVTGGNDPAERTHIDAIAKDATFHDFAGRLSLPESCAVIARAKIICAVDSLPVHLADAVGTPVVTLFGPTNPFHWRPRSATSRIVTASGVEPITPTHPKGPMSDIDADRVTREISELL